MEDNRNTVTVILHRNGVRKTIPVTPDNIPVLREPRYFPGDPDPWMVTGMEFIHYSEAA